MSSSLDQRTDNSVTSRSTNSASPKPVKGEEGDVNGTGSAKMSLDLGNYYTIYTSNKRRFHG